MSVSPATPANWNMRAAVDLLFDRTISPAETMWKQNQEQDDAEYLNQYFAIGASGMDCINLGLLAANLPPQNIKRILDLPCGHGRVLRYMKAAFPHAEIVACDLDQPGVDFCAKTFGATPVYSHLDPFQISIAPGSMDLIWVGSLVTHLSADLFVNFLNFFHRSLRPGGVFIFTTHGRRAYDWTRRGQYRYGLDDEQTAMVMDDYERLGFGYSHYTGSQTYGQTLSRPDWVYRQLARIDELRIAAFLEAGWNNHQDVFVCVRDPQWKVVHPHAFL